MNAATILLVLAVGLALEGLGFVALRRVMRVDANTAGLAVGLGATLVYVPWALLTWPGADVFAIHLAIFLTAAYVLATVGGQQGRRRHWAPLFIGGFFAAVVGWNVVFLGVAEQGITGVFARLLPEPRSGSVADSRFPGTVPHAYQEKEALYNAYLEQVREQDRRGWQVRKGWTSPPRAGKPAVFRVEVRDRAGLPIADAEVRGQFLRTSNSDYDFDFRMLPTGGGHYRLDTELPLPGRWELVLQVRRGEALHEVRAHTVAGAP